MNISSIVVKTLPKHLEEVVEELKNCKVCDYHMHDEEGRIIITIEGSNVNEELEKLRVIEAIKYVASADMQMSYSEDELDENIDILNNADAVPSMLNEENVDPNKIIYNGDLKKKDIYGFSKHLENKK